MLQMLTLPSLVHVVSWYALAPASPKRHENEKNKIQISEIPVEWEEDSNSKVKIIKTIIEDIKGLLRLRFKGIPTIKDS